MAKTVKGKLVEVGLYGALMEACYREAERIVASDVGSFTTFTGAPVGIQQVDRFLSKVEAMVKNLSRDRRVTQVAALLFEAAMGGEVSDAATI